MAEQRETLVPPVPATEKTGVVKARVTSKKNGGPLVPIG
jgi:hypothetical protein